MKSKLTIGLIGCTLLTTLTPISVKAELTDAEHLTKFGTSRRPQTCPSKSEPRTGRLTLAQAIKYTRCYFEKEGERLSFVDISNFQLSAPRRVTEKDSLTGWTINNIDKTQPIYDIKAYAVTYFCFPIENSAGLIGGPGKSCGINGSQIKDPINSDGKCFKDAHDRWSCRLAIAYTPTIWGPPPAK